MTRGRLLIILALTSLRCGVVSAQAPERDAKPAPLGPAPSAETEKFLQPLLDAHNRERRKEGVAELKLDPALTQAAQLHANDMAAHQKMAHEGSDGSTPFDRLRRLKYPYKDGGENVAEGYRTVQAVMDGWMNSPPHRENILRNYTRAGFAIARDEDDKPYWAAEFATPYEKIEPAEASSELIAAINDLRGKEKLPALKANESLSSVAATIAKGLSVADSLEAVSNKELDLSALLKAEKYRFAKVAESAASGQSDPKEVLATWEKDGSTKTTILETFTEAGAGYAASATGRPYWTLILAKPLSR